MQTKKTMAQPCVIKNAARPPVAFLKNTSFLKKMVLLFTIVLITNAAHAQKSLRIVKMRQITWDADTKQWSPWPAQFSVYEAEYKPVITLTKLDDGGYKFKVDLKLKDSKFTFNVAYDGFDAKNNWSKYKVENGDKINIVGSTLSKLAMYGWPDSKVNIYFILKSENVAFEFN